jgi:NAD(P)H-hydrate epimerase
MGRLWEGAIREKMPAEQRIQTAVGFALHSGCVVVLKGAGTVVTDGNKKVYVNTTGNPGMATAGAGDALTGVIAALAGGGMNNFDAAVAGTYIHGLAGDLAAEAVGQDSMIATDIVRNLGNAFVQMRHPAK